MPSYLDQLLECARTDTLPDPELAIKILQEDVIPLEDLLRIGEIPRKKHFGENVQIHILNNVKNGHCTEDCGYCAQRKDSGASAESRGERGESESSGPDAEGQTGEGIASYSSKTEEEILLEARDAYQAGAYRYCLVVSGKGPSVKGVHFFADVIRRLKTEYPGMEICLSAGILSNPEQAEVLKIAGLDRYNHNLNTSIAHYDDICSTHQFSDRVDTLKNMAGAGISLCSGVIVGMGENDLELLDVAYELHRHRVASIPVNFFIPIPNNTIRARRELTPEYSLRVLTLFRLINPESEIRMAAGRELYLKERQKDGLRVANSLFVSGYLNVKGSNFEETIALIEEAGCRVDLKRSELEEDMREYILVRKGENGDGQARSAPISEKMELKSMEDLRPYRSLSSSSSES